jgi:hypothetical protein
MATIGSSLKNKLKNKLNRQQNLSIDKLGKNIISNPTNIGIGINGSTQSILGGLLGTDSISKKKSSVSSDKKYLCKYQVSNLVIMKNSEKITMDHSNILSIEYMNDYEFNIMALLKVSLRIDIRRKLWILKNKKDILVKLELNKIGMDTENEKYITSSEKVWNQEFAMYFNDEDESIDIETMESRINLNEGKDFQSNNMEGENYFESQNTLDIYLVLPELMKGSRYSFNKVYTKNTLQNIIGHMLTQSGHKHVLMSKFENDEIYQELLLPINPVYKNLIYLDQYYGLYKNGAIIYYDVDVLYILNANGKLTAKRQDEWTETTFLISKISNSTPGNGMVRKEGEKIFYPTVSDMDVNPQNFAISKNAGLGSSAKIVVTDTIDVEVHDADQSFIDQRNENVTFIKDKNKFTGDVVKARMEENECILYISGNNLDIKAFTPNKIFKVVFDDPGKHKAYGKHNYRLAYSYHFLKLESEGYMTASHRIVLKKTATGKEADKNPINPLSVGSILGDITSPGGLKNFENRLKSEISNIGNTLINKVSNEIITSIGDSTKSNKKKGNKLSRIIGSNVDNYKDQLKNKFRK